MVNMKYVRLLKGLANKHQQLNGESIEKTFRRLLGLRSPDISLTQHVYCPNWPEWFAQEAELLNTQLDDLTISMIEHIGSTSIANMSSKQIIDMAVLVDEPCDGEQAKQALATLGYQFYGVSPISTESCWYWKLEQQKCFVIHLAASDAACFDQPILFRDYLRANPAKQVQYQAFKQQALAEDQDLFSYSVRKLDIYCDILQQAQKWQRAQACSEQEEPLCP